MKLLLSFSVVVELQYLREIMEDAEYSASILTGKGLQCYGKNYDGGPRCSMKVLNIFWTFQNFHCTFPD